ncbi:hypothetical protein IAG41_11790 [Sphingomonas sp. JC676]|uniref:hypothetical protein n=1 Tax=Sphingomonas sp. JC676 TaxID=2768065 RepID=UPI0016582333|nr:hypothetical protein [Sphingomonas sp. JC676]MBC9033077.1 hypothetical protein [Sphingomonas sp. JC676]
MTATTADGALEPERKRTWLRTAKILAYAWLLLVLCYFCWQGFWYTGLYAMIAEWEHEHYDWYMPVGNVAALTIVFGALPLLIVKLIELRRSRHTQPEIIEERAAGLRVAERLGRWLIGGVIVFVIAALLSVALVLLDLPTDGGTPQQLSAVQNRFKVREGLTQLEIDKAPKRAILFRMRWPGELVRSSFAQIDAKLANGEHVTVFAELSQNELENFEHDGVATSRLGVLVKNGLPGTTISYMNGAGMHVVEPYYALYRSELSARLRYLAVSAQLGMCALITLLFWVAQRLRIRGIKRRLGTSVAKEAAPA